MIELIFVVCLTTSDLCEERSQLYDQEIGLIGCMLGAQAELARWTEAHPGRRVTRWSCRFAMVGARDA